MFQIDFNNNIPIYEQLGRRMKENILKGYLKSGDALPSVRNMARQLNVTPNTVQKAYRALEQEKVIVTVRGKGAFVAQTRPTVNLAEKILECKRQLRPVIGDLIYLGLSSDEIAEIAKEVVSEMKEEDHD